MTTRFAERLTPLAAAGTALAAFACCVPLGLVGVAGVLTVSTLFDALQSWFLGAAVILLALGAWQCYRSQRSCRHGRTRFSLVVLGLSAAVVVAVLLFPQNVAAWIADYIL